MTNISERSAMKMRKILDNDNISDNDLMSTRGFVPKSKKTHRWRNHDDKEIATRTVNRNRQLVTEEIEQDLNKC